MFVVYTVFYLVRSRAKELAELLGDVENIKAERKKAKKNRNKYTGVGSEGGMSFSGGGSAMSSGGGGSGRYEGFGSESNYSSGGGGSTNQSSFGNSGNDFFDDERPGRYDDFDSPASQRRGSSKSSRTMSPPPATRKVSDAKPKQKTAKELNLFDFDEPVAVASISKGKSNDDDWGDFAGGDANGKTSRFFFFIKQLLIFFFICAIRRF